MYFSVNMVAKTFQLLFFLLKVIQKECELTMVYSINDSKEHNVQMSKRLSNSKLKILYISVYTVLATSRLFKAMTWYELLYKLIHLTWFVQRFQINKVKTKK